MQSLSGYHHIFGEVRSQLEVAVAANQQRSGSVKTEYSVFARGIIGAQMARSLVTPLGGPERADQGWFDVGNYVQHVKLFMVVIGGFCVFHQSSLSVLWGVFLPSEANAISFAAFLS